MSGYEKYPQSGLYRKHREEIKKHAEDLAHKEIALRINQMFGLKEGAVLSSSEKTELQAFVDYATRRLSAAAIMSRMNRHHVEEGNIVAAFQEMAPKNLATHDLWHAAIATAHSKGENVVPAYAQAENALEQALDPQALEEEATALLLDPDQPEDRFIKRYFKDKEYFAERLKKKAWCRDFYSSIQDLKEKDTGQHFAKAFLFHFLASELGTPDGPEALDDRKRILDMVEHPTSLYMSIARACYENASASPENIDPRFRVTKFKELIAPLRARLGKRKAA